MQAFNDSQGAQDRHSDRSTLIRRYRTPLPDQATPVRMFSSVVRYGCVFCDNYHGFMFRSVVMPLLNNRSE